MAKVTYFRKLLKSIPNEEGLAKAYLGGGISDLSKLWIKGEHPQFLQVCGEDILKKIAFAVMTRDRST